MVKTCYTEEQLTLATIAYDNTHTNADLLTPPQLFFKRQINSRLGIMANPSMLSDDQRVKLQEATTKHPTPPADNVKGYGEMKAIWFMKDGCPEWSLVTSTPKTCIQNRAG